jgi:hypothetical protein
VCKEKQAKLNNMEEEITVSAYKQMFGGIQEVGIWIQVQDENECHDEDGRFKSPYLESICGERVSVVRHRLNK